MTYVFYDTETTGTDPDFDQILQFAAIRTDDELNVVDTLNVNCRLLPYVAPSPGALLVHGIPATEIMARPLSHYAMMRQIERRLSEWSVGGAVFVGWNSMPFDEKFLRQAFYKTLQPIYKTVTQGNGRADGMALARAAAESMPGSLSLPAVDGKAVFKLGAIAEANGIVLDHAHDALADTEATLAIARLVKEKAPSLWTEMLANARKIEVERRLSDAAPMLLSETYFGTTYHRIVAPVGPSRKSPNSWIVFDLQFDPRELAAIASEALEITLRGALKPTRTVRTNAQPTLLPVDYAPAKIRGGRLPLEVYRDRATALAELGGFRSRLVDLVDGLQREKPGSAFVEQRIYERFPSTKEQRTLTAFRRADWVERAALIDKFDDDRHREIALRLVGADSPQSLDAGKRRQWELWRRDRLNPSVEVPWLTLPKAIAEAKELRAKEPASKQPLIDAASAVLAEIAEGREAAEAQETGIPRT